MPKLYAPHLNDLSVGGLRIEKGEDGSFDVPEEHVATVKGTFGARDTKEPPPVNARQPVPADEVDRIRAGHEEIGRHRDQLVTRVRDLEQRNQELERVVSEQSHSNLVTTVNDLRRQVADRDQRIRDLEKAQADKGKPGAKGKGEKE
jgi:TolA-binding protein